MEDILIVGFNLTQNRVIKFVKYFENNLDERIAEMQFTSDWQSFNDWVNSKMYWSSRETITYHSQNCTWETKEWQRSNMSMNYWSHRTKQMQSKPKQSYPPSTPFTHPCTQTATLNQISNTSNVRKNMKARDLNTILRLHSYSHC